MKVYELAKEKGYQSKEFLTMLKEMGVAVKTPISPIPEESLNKARSVTPKIVENPKVEAPIEQIGNLEKLKLREFPKVSFEGLDERFSQCALGIRRQIVDGRKVFSLLTFAFDPSTMETKLVKDEPKRTDAEAILDFRMAVRKMKVEQ